ncbi:MAG: hypothetical protein N4A70_12200 [Pelagimonas sp.]|nr:hypothetical protein [Pelagimonas sp.]
MSSENKPVLITAEQLVARLEEQREEIAQTLAGLAEDVRDIQTRMRQGDIEKKAEATRLMGDLRYWLRAIRDTEAEIDSIRRKESGIGDSYGLDLEAAEFAVRCRLDSLRACCCEE